MIETTTSGGPPVISVLVPAYNVASYLEESVRSVLTQEVQAAIEVVVVDDGATDGTSQVADALAAGDPRVKVVHQANAGVAAARNRAFRESSGDYVMWLDGDDVLRPQALARLLAALEAAPQAGSAYGTARLMAVDGSDIGKASDAKSHFVKRTSGDILPTLLATNFIINGGVVLSRRQVVDRTDLYDGSLSCTEDWNFTCKLAAAGGFQFVGDDPVLDYRVRPGSLSRDGTYGSEREYRFTLDKTFGHPLITGRVPAADLARLRRQRWSDMLRRVGTRHLATRAWGPAARSLARSLVAQPGNARSAIMLACALMRWIPGPVRRRTGL